MLKMLAFENQLLQIHVAVIKVYQLIIKILRVHILHLSKKTKLGVYFSHSVSRCDKLLISPCARPNKILGQ